jgi:DNA-binding response OmpR family regulator
MIISANRLAKGIGSACEGILRRTRAANPATDVLHYKDITLNPEKLSVHQAGRALSLSPLEFKLLYTLAKNPGRVFSRQQLMEEIYDGTNIIFDRTVDAHIKNLRKKLDDSPKKPRYLSSVFGVGYKLLDNETQPTN